MRKLLLAALLLVSACGPNASDKTEKKEDAGAKPSVALSAEEGKSLGITTVAELAAADHTELAKWFGPTIGPHLRMLVRRMCSTGRPL